MVIRTISEERCSDCGSITNAYAPEMGRLCPHCIARRMAEFGRNLALYKLHHLTIGTTPLTEQQIRDICADKSLFSEPLIDHRDDIETHLKLKLEK